MRFIGNHSSGKMGFEIAKKAAALGAEVFNIGTYTRNVNSELIEVIPVVTAEDMYNAVHSTILIRDMAIFSAAVADYRPKIIANRK